MIMGASFISICVGILSLCMITSKLNADDRIKIEVDTSALNAEAKELWQNVTIRGTIREANEILSALGIETKRSGSDAYFVGNIVFNSPKTIRSNMTFRIGIQSNGVVFAPWKLSFIPHQHAIEDLIVVIPMRKVPSPFSRNRGVPEKWEYVAGTAMTIELDVSEYLKNVVTESAPSESEK